MTKQEYDANVYIGKHEPHKYQVYRRREPLGDNETVIVIGKAAVKAAINGCWDVLITDLYTGEIKLPKEMGYRE